MKCPVCKKGTMEKVKDTIKQDAVEYEALKCKICGEELMNMHQLKSLACKYRKLRKAKDVTFSKWGNSIAVRIPNEIVGEYGIEEGKHGVLTTDKEGIRIIPV